MISYCGTEDPANEVFLSELVPDYVVSKLLFNGGIELNDALTDGPVLKLS